MEEMTNRQRIFWLHNLMSVYNEETVTDEHLADLMAFAEASKDALDKLIASYQLAVAQAEHAEKLEGTEAAAQKLTEAQEKFDQIQQVQAEGVKK